MRATLRVARDPPQPFAGGAAKRATAEPGPERASRGTDRGVKRYRDSLAALAACAVLSPRDATANGRFPTAQFFALGEGAARDRVAITATFGLIVSLDGGEQWRWICEDAIGFSGEFDPVTAITDSGALVVTRPAGAAIARGDWCDFASIPLAQTDPSIDVTARGARVAISQQLATGGAQLLLSDDDGASFRLAWTSSNYFVNTIDYSPINSLRLYATSQSRLGQPWILRSENGGDAFDPTTTAPLAMTEATFIAAVDSVDDRRVLLRAFATDGTSVLSRSDDGGATTRPLAASAGPMVGAAATEGFDTIWAASAEDGARLRRSDDGGRSFRALATTIRARSLRYRRGVLFATAAEQQAGYSFGCSQDGGESFRRLLAVDDLRGPELCREGSTVRTRCAAQWPAVRAQLLAIARPPAPPRGRCAEGVWDAATNDAAQDGGADATIDSAQDVAITTNDASERDATAIDDRPTVTDVREVSTDDRTPPLRATGGCQCSTQPQGAGRGDATRAAWLLGIGLTVARWLRGSSGWSRRTT